MQFKFSNEPLEKIKTDLVVILCPQKKKNKDDKGTAVLQKSDYGVNLDEYLGGLISKIITEEKFHGDSDSHKLLYSFGKIPARAILLIGIGEMKDFNLDVPRKAGAAVVKAANSISAHSATLVVQPENLKGFDPAVRVQAFAEGIILGGYKFERYKDKKNIEPDTLKEVILITNKGQAKLGTAVKRGTVIAEGVNMVRDLVNLPAKDLTPELLAKKAKDIAVKENLNCKILGPKEIEKEKMGLFLAVSAGSKNEPRFIHLAYKPAKKAKARAALIGKGVTFDTGGYDIKPGNGMLHMKDDMAGAAVCMAVIKIISELKLPIAIDVYIPATDNVIDGASEVPGNIVRARNGKTVEIISTDAEGRLILADAITYALEKKPDFIIDAATLTGHVLYSLGEIYTAVLGNNQKLADKYLSASKEENEPAWQLPLVAEYKKGMKDGIADLKNIGKSKAGTIVGALFLEEFVGKTKWLHLDIAESSWTEEDRDYTPKGGTGATIRSLVNMLASF